MHTIQFYVHYIVNYLKSLFCCVICGSVEISELADHGISLPPNMQGLTEDQIIELKLQDEWQERCIPSGGADFRKDKIGRRNGYGSLHLDKIYI